MNSKPDYSKTTFGGPFFLVFLILLVFYITGKPEHTEHLKIMFVNRLPVFKVFNSFKVVNIKNRAETLFWVVTRRHEFHLT